MSAIHIDTNELRTIAHDLRALASRTGSAGSDAGNSVWHTDLGPVAGVYIARVGGEQAQVTVLATRINAHAAALDIEAVRTDAGEAAARVIAGLSGLGLAFLRTSRDLTAGWWHDTQTAVTRSWNWAGERIDDLAAGVRSLRDRLKNAWDKAANWVKNMIHKAAERLALIFTEVAAMGNAILDSIRAGVLRIEHATMAGIRGIVGWTSLVGVSVTACLVSGFLWLATKVDPELAKSLAAATLPLFAVTGSDSTAVMPKQSHEDFLTDVARLPQECMSIIRLSDGSYIIELRGIGDINNQYNSLPRAAEGQLLDWSIYEEAVKEQLMRLPAGASVMVVAHSQGGITALHVGADRDVRAHLNVSHILTAGSPTDDLPDYAQLKGTKVLALRNHGDPVAYTGRTTDLGGALNANAYEHQFGTPIPAWQNHAVPGNYSYELGQMHRDYEAGRESQQVADFFRSSEHYTDQSGWGTRQVIDLRSP